jgi:hypothetical protein
MFSSSIKIWLAMMMIMRREGTFGGNVKKKENDAMTRVLQSQHAARQRLRRTTRMGTACAVSDQTACHADSLVPRGRSSGGVAESIKNISGVRKRGPHFSSVPLKHITISTPLEGTLPFGGSGRDPVFGSRRAALAGL